MAAETIGEMQKRMDEASEKIGKAEAECEAKLTVLKLKSNCMEPDGLPIKPEKAMLIADYVIDWRAKGRSQNSTRSIGRPWSGRRPGRRC